MSATFYAYVHAKPDGSIFYVGKGKGDRAYDFCKRSEYHKRISNKYGKNAILVGKMECSSEEVAFDLERGLIKCLRRMGAVLTNQTDGGEGTSGYKVSADEVAARRIRNAGSNNPWFGKKHTDEAKSLISYAAKVSGAQKKNWTDERSEACGNRIKQWIAENGHPMAGKKHTERTRTLLSESHKGLTYSDAARSKLSAYVNSTMVVTDGKVTVRVPRTEVDTYLNNGFVKGCCRMRELRWMNDGKTDTRVPASKVEAMLLNGWTLGRLGGKRGKSK